uniref:Uncharacterized protein n=1 Tax=Avena sativa TaxID=4498 RepID=A0ACD5ZYI7_AVESA
MASGDMPPKLSPNLHHAPIFSNQPNLNQPSPQSPYRSSAYAFYPPLNPSPTRFQPLLPSPMEGNQQRSEVEQRNQQAQIEAGGIPDLALTLQAMSLAEPVLCKVQDNQVMKQEDLDFSFCLLMKIACTGGTPKNISQTSLEQAMAKAWREKYYAISQVSNTVFMAHFRSQEGMILVYTRQPWTVNANNLLIAWFDPNVNANSISDYNFEHILVNVRAYGIPRNRRSLSLLMDILNQVGSISEFHILQETNLFAKQDYIWGTTKIKVHNPVKDRFILTYADNSTCLAYLHYERIKRICHFCGTMFHTVQNCSWRNNLITDISKSNQTGPEIPTYRFGQWIMDETCIPMEAIQKAKEGAARNNQVGNQILTRLQRLFSQDPKGKAKTSGTKKEQGNKGGQNSQGSYRPYSAAVNIAQSPRTVQTPLRTSLVTVHTSPTQYDGDQTMRG